MSLASRLQARRTQSASPASFSSPDPDCGVLRQTENLPQPGSTPLSLPQTSLFSDNMFDGHGAGLGEVNISAMSSSFKGGSMWPNSSASFDPMFGEMGNGTGTGTASNAGFISAQTVSMDLSPAFIAQLKIKSQHLPPAAKAALETYLSAPSLAERLALHYIQNLSIENSLQQQAENQEANWAVSPTLKKTIAKFAKAYMLSSTARYYIKCSPERIIVSAMRSTGVKNLPSEDDVSGCDILKSAASRALVTVRSQIKDTIVSTSEHAKGSDQLPADKCDLGSLAELLVSNLKEIPVSLALMQRLAVMRDVLSNHPDLISDNARGFWPQVDIEMAGIYGAGLETPRGQQDILSDLHLVYQIDTETHGPPKVSPANIGDPKFHWPKYVQNINSLALKATITITDDTNEKRGMKRKNGFRQGGRAHKSLANEDDDDGEDDESVKD
ncbi:hypothetical protein GGU10DRAFT_380718 [Lentinula aff. detonsa]|uniref:Uncharacterized protein n=1 Tax=Lentinula aff. detonsa TaxID=2804958 RepID=A0AA38KBM2_9AGAR|nr:hypothetical protein GGU10DRAFT_380718 [Lentinula aff. detonsa]